MNSLQNLHFYFIYLFILLFVLKNWPETEEKSVSIIIFVCLMINQKRKCKKFVMIKKFLHFQNQQLNRLWAFSNQNFRLKNEENLKNKLNHCMGTVYKLRHTNFKTFRLPPPMSHSVTISLSPSCIVTSDYHFYTL